MSTIEKANSARYLAHRFGLDLHVGYTPIDAESNNLLRRGFTGLGQVQSYALLHFEDRAQLLFATTAEPARIRRLCSEDLIHWQEVAPLSLAAGPIRTLHLHQYGFAAILAITTQSGETQVFSSVDFGYWKPLARLPHSWTSTPWYVYAKYPSKIAGGQEMNRTLNIEKADRALTMLACATGGEPLSLLKRGGLEKGAGAEGSSLVLLGNRSGDGAVTLVSLSSGGKGLSAQWQPEDSQLKLKLYPKAGKGQGRLKLLCLIHI